ncbi:CBS domain-containing protein [Siccirubricoccus phaeus]|jgi:CBS domain-containing protein|uniref:CBS domain-containing protein n=1 Tax=Siccirubricoccus phaeus TaxID=2595053 RepID=UPI0011F2A27F|nr:CBS domain-containing protein [Siccirubricoccus phaeus]
MSEATETFIRIFEEIVGEVNRRAGAPGSHAFEIERAADRDGTVRRHRTLLLYIRDVRNTLQHPRHHAPGHAVQVTEGFLTEVQDLLRRLRNPPTANSVGVARRDIRTARLDDQLGELAEIMKREGFSHLPILDERDTVIGVFNEAAVFDHLWAEPEMIIGRGMRIEDILSHCRLGAGHTETFKFVRPGTPLDDLVQMFVALESPTTRVGAAFVTASGKETDPLQRMITPWDVLAGARD